MKKLFYLVFIFSLFMMSCNNDDDNGSVNGEDTELQGEIVKMKVMMEKETANIFEATPFRLIPEKDIYLSELKETYDSLVWTVTDLGRLNVFSNYTNALDVDVKFLMEWSHCFFIPKEYETFLLGYKDQKIIMRDTLLVNINNEKDFLCFNWDDITESASMSSGYQNVFSFHLDFITNYQYEEGRPSIDLSISYNNTIDEVEFSEYSRENLFSLITKLYSEPRFSEADNPDEIEEQYNKLFKHKKNDGAEPLNIWITPSSRIVLLRYKSYTLGETMQYRIQAEPNY